MDETVPQLAQLALGLRQLRRDAGLSLDELSKEVSWSKTKLHDATTGREMPKWELVSAWVRACDPGANLDLWQARHKAAAAAVQAHGSGEGTVPDGASGPPSAVSEEEPSGDVLSNPLLFAAELTRVAPPPLSVHPLPVRFCPAPPDLVSDRAPVDLTGSLGELPEIFSLLAGHQRLVVLGDPGSGRTHALGLLAQALRRDPRKEGGRPLLLSLRHWRPEAEPFVGWLVERMEAESGATTGALTPGLLSELLEQGKIVLLLDDFDYLEPLQRVWALRQLGSLSARMVLASRIDPFTETVEATDSPLVDSVGIVLQPLGLDDLDGWVQLTRYAHRAPLARSKWEPVFAQCRQAPDDPRVRMLLAVLASPPMAAAAQALCSDGRTDPMSLLRKPDRAALEEPLVARLMRGLTPEARLTSPREWTRSVGREWISDALRLLSVQRRLSGRDLMSLEGTGLAGRAFRVGLTGLSALLVLLHFTIVASDESNSYSSSYEGAYGAGHSGIGIFIMTPVCALLTYVMVSNPPVPASFPVSWRGAKRALISRQAVPAVICLAFVVLDPGLSAVWFVMAGFFLLRAACTPSPQERPSTLRPAGGGYFLQEEPGARNVIAADLLWTGCLLFMALFATGLGGATEMDGFLAVFDLPLRLTLVAASAASVRWLPHLMLDWHTFLSVPCALEYAAHVGVLEKKDGSYSFRHPEVAEYFVRSASVSTRRPLLRRLRQPAAPPDGPAAFGGLDGTPPPPPA
ncbi:helix-turn-helix domain-containing protein [Streptomyces sp. NPDC089919]|uniref:helix-turn-helix domain-containing protein n=1 Tax=Streptomyces sp. NPDC089919 TaxID=3155188 RepID=UPI0034489769